MSTQFTVVILILTISVRTADTNCEAKCSRKNSEEDKVQRVLLPVNVHGPKYCKYLKLVNDIEP